MDPWLTSLFGFVRVGLIPSAGGCTRLTALVGPSRAKQVIICGETVDVNRAVDWGIAQFAPEGDLMEVRGFLNPKP